VVKRVEADSPHSLNVTFVEQAVQRGTGDAVAVGLTAFADDDLDETSTVLIVPGDTPLLRRQTLAELISFHETSGHGATLLATHMADPTGYGRLVRNKHGLVARIVEEAEATPQERAIQEVNTSIYCFRRDLLGPALRRVSPDNRQAEYYLTGV